MIPFEHELYYACIAALRSYELVWGNEAVKLFMESAAMFLLDKEAAAERFLSSNDYREHALRARTARYLMQFQLMHWHPQLGIGASSCASR